MSLIAPQLKYEIQNWRPGYLDSPDSSRLEIGATPLAANSFFFSLNKDGSCTMGKRPGARLLNPTCISADARVDGLYDFRREGVSGGLLLAVCNGSLTKWDGASTFTVIGALGTAAGAPVEFSTSRNLVFIMDGTVMKAYDGTSVFTPGLAAPTSVGVLTAVAPAAGGVTGTYQILQVWYDSVHDHESSPTAPGTATVFAAQDRQHARPGGAVPANADKWRSYVRRTDTNETTFKLAVEATVATATSVESVPDTTRLLATTLLAPLPNQNDAPPVFALMANAQGYAMGVVSNDSYVSVSALGDPQGWHPKDKIGVARGDGKNVTTLKAVGSKVLVQKAKRSYLLTGDRMPFIPDELGNSFGNHSQASSVEAVGKYWGWDRQQGPYVSDLETQWDPLAVGRISTILARVNRTAEIRCCHAEPFNLICWIVSVDAVSTRTRVMLAYNYLLGAWLPPIYGLEYGSMTAFQTDAGVVNFYVGDQWGRVYQYFVDNAEGPPSGTVSATVTSATASTVTCAAATFYTTGHGLKGMPCAAVSPGGTWYFRTIQSNTGTVVTIDTTNGQPWSTVPTAGWTFYIGAIDWFWTTPLIDFEHPLEKKRGGFLYAEFRSATTSGTLSIRGRFNDDQAAWDSSDTLKTPLTAGTWGAILWGTGAWSRGDKRPTKQRLMRAFYSAQFEMSNRYPNQPIEVVTFGLGADPLGVWASGR